MSMRLRAVFVGICPNCGGRISDVRLLMGLPCDRCLPIPDEELLEELRGLSKEEVMSFCLRKLKEFGTLKLYGRLAEFHEEVAGFVDFFERALGCPPWSAQRTWARRALAGKSFAIIAPTGSGKTAFGSILALYMASKGRRSYILLPTSLLVKQVYEKICSMRDKAGVEARIVCYHSMLTKKEAEEALRALQEGDFDILITTSFFLARRRELLKGHRFDLVFVDDVDAFLRSSKNVDVVLEMLGVPGEAIEKALEVLKLRTEVSRKLRKKDLGGEALEELRGKLLDLEEELEAIRRMPGKGVLIVSGACLLYTSPSPRDRG